MMILRPIVDRLHAFPSTTTTAALTSSTSTNSSSNGSVVAKPASSSALTRQRLVHSIAVSVNQTLSGEDSIVVPRGASHQPPVTELQLLEEQKTLLPYYLATTTTASTTSSRPHHNDPLPSDLNEDLNVTLDFSSPRNRISSSNNIQNASHLQIDDSSASSSRNMVKN